MSNPPSQTAPSCPVATLNIIGGGRLGQALGRLWADNGQFLINDVMCRSEPAAQVATGFIGAGRPIVNVEALRLSTVTLIATPDDQIAACCDMLVAAGRLEHGGVVFHCSGTLSSDVLGSAAAIGCLTASVHPIRSFADPAMAVAGFSGTWCGLEGQAGATTLLGPAFEAIGAHLVTIAAADKTLYHSAAVFASNYLVTMMDAAIETYARAGIARETALLMIAPLARGTVDNVLSLGPQQALTGPVQRGDQLTVDMHFQALSAWRRPLGMLYRRLAERTKELARRRNIDK